MERSVVELLGPNSIIDAGLITVCAWILYCPGLARDNSKTC
jgi:hypothetical protein